MPSCAPVVYRRCAVGRSITYRTGAFHLLAQIALRRELPPPLAPGGVRSALTAVMRRSLEAPGTFDGEGWLTVGFCGHQPHLGGEDAAADHAI
jgi:hypothetical protein